jgi:hypothetical protein
MLDETRKLVRELNDVAFDHSSPNSLYSSEFVSDMADRKSGAVHRYRDEEWRVKIALADLKALEGTR